MDDLDRSRTIGRSSRRSWAILDDLHNQLTLFSSRFQPFDRIFVWDFLDVVHPSLLQVHHCLELHLVILNWKLTTRNLVSIPREYERGSERVACPANRTVPRIFKLSVSKISLMVFVISSRKSAFINFRFFQRRFQSLDWNEKYNSELKCRSRVFAEEWPTRASHWLKLLV